MSKKDLIKQRAVQDSFIGKKLKRVHDDAFFVDFEFEDGSMIRAQGYKAVDAEYYPREIKN